MSSTKEIGSAALSRVEERNSELSRQNQRLKNKMNHLVAEGKRKLVDNEAMEVIKLRQLNDKIEELKRKNECIERRNHKLNALIAFNSVMVLSLPAQIISTNMIAEQQKINSTWAQRKFYEVVININTYIHIYIYIFFFCNFCKYKLILKKLFLLVHPYFADCSKPWHLQETIPPDTQSCIPHPKGRAVTPPRGKWYPHFKPSNVIIKQI